MSDSHVAFSQHVRNRAGVIVSCRSHEGRETVYHCIGGGVLGALRAACALIDAQTDGPWYVTAISTPETVYRDVAGRGMAYEDGTTPLLPENQYLGKIGRKDLLLPSMRGVSKRSTTKYREEGL